MTPLRSSRWALSFADLCLLLLGFFAFLQAHGSDRMKLVESMRATFGDADAASALSRSYEAHALFEPDEAVLKAEARARFQALGREAAAGRSSIRIASSGMDPATRRLDGWELAAARVTAVARALQAGGLAERRIEIVMSRMDSKATGQRISVTTIG